MTHFTFVRTLALGAVLMLGAAFMPAGAHAQVSCTFTRDLAMGTAGADVSCLQRWLGAQGHFYGASTGYFGTATRDAVVRWQIAQNLSTTGVFRVSNLPRQSAPLGATYTNNSTGAINAIEDAVDAYEEAEDEVDGASGNKARNAQDSLDDARQDLIESFRAFTRSDYSLAISRARDAEDAANDAMDEVDGRSSNSRDGNKSDAREAIDDAQDELDNAWDEVDEANDDREDTDEAEELLMDADDAITDAEDAYDDRDYDEATERAEDAQDLIDEALDELENASDRFDEDDEDDARVALEDAEDEISAAWDKVNNAADRGRDTDDAEDYLNDADDELDAGWDAWEDGDFDEVFDRIDEIEELIDRALDEI